MDTNLLFKKTCRLVITLFIILTVNFALPRLMPGDPVITMLGQEAAVISETDLGEIRSRHGLDKPLTEQYSAYWRSLSQGELGYSYHYRQPVTEIIRQHLTWTLILLCPVVALSSLLALLLGMAAGWKAGSALDKVITCGSLVIYSLPQFLMAMLLLTLFSFNLQLFPLGGLSSGSGGSALANAADTAWHLTLPLAALTLSAASAKLLVIRNSTVKHRCEDFVTYATVKGLSPCRILAVHLLRNACLPLLSLIALNIGFIVSGALVVEIVFSITGMGTLLYEAAVYRDYPLLQGCFLVLTIFVVVANTLADFAYCIADPRISHSS
ncbi:ABC-type dipeptide/oligopeptide/nickel transport system, permease component [uncultured Sporomusa sp.]|uniref:ABC-type dipeptide/oligopeptide/nickel transport system, permease component n=1 Tax=uncultured Sporomusa sp. TaxID=307249 RepID=A0A212M0G8_9FIRM|nr:ABC transporter permease [uncultured Sporomusa sp.]SCM83256.1 ABC-type dipeptide/oligopeptide/nickel transport system, permease component [uncultured Sporomusa sp.]